MTKILVIEDENDIRDEIMTWLDFEGYQTVGASDGVEGVNAAIRHQPDLIICDISMPRLDGYGVMLDVRANSFTQLTPFIFLTAKTSLQDIRAGMDLGADDYLTKPFERLDLLRAINTRLEKKSAQMSEQQHEINVFKGMMTYERGQRLLQANLAAMFSHDFRTPLAIITASGSMLRELTQRLGETQLAPHIDRIESSVRQLNQMMDDMMLVAQMETGKFTYKPAPVDVGEFFNQLIGETIAAYGKTHRIALENNFSGSIMSDTRLLRQIISNLLSNAVKYSPINSEVRVHIEEKNGECVITVRDQGIGIPEADQAKLFEVFQRGSNTGSINGTGLGLAIVKQAVGEAGGRVELESKPGLGTTFTVSIPAQRP